MENYYVLNRQNTMVYYDDKKSLIKNYFKEVSIETSQQTYRLLIKILHAAKKEISLKEIYAITSNDKQTMQLLKILYEIGSIFIYSHSYRLDNYSKKGWYPILLQYLPPESDVLTSCKIVDKTNIVITPEIDSQFPELKSLFLKNDLKVTVDTTTIDENDWIISMGHDFEHPNLISLSFSADKLLGKKHVNQRREEHSTEKEYRGHKHSLLYKVGPYYTMLFIVKSIVGIAKSAFSLNREGEFYEYDLVEENYKQTIEPLSLPTFTHPQSNLDFISKFESFIQKELAIPISVSGWRSEEYADLYQMGFTTYSLTNHMTKETFVLAGLDYLQTAMSAIVKGLGYYLNKGLDQDAWFLTSPENYYVDKSLFLLNYVEEPYEVYKIDQEAIARIKDVVEYVRTFEFQLAFYMKQYKQSESVIVYMYDKTRDRMYTDGKRTIYIEEKLTEFVFNYLLMACNQDKSITTMFKELDCTEKAALLHAASNEIHRFETIDETAFMEASLHIIEQNDVHCVERAWKYEAPLNESNLIVRKMEVGTYHTSSV